MDVINREGYLKTVYVKNFVIYTNSNDNKYQEEFSNFISKNFNNYSMSFYNELDESKYTWRAIIELGDKSKRKDNLNIISHYLEKTEFITAYSFGKYFDENDDENDDDDFSSYVYVDKQNEINSHVNNFSNIENFI